MPESCSLCKVAAIVGLMLFVHEFPRYDLQACGWLPQTPGCGCAVLEACGAQSDSDQDAAAETCHLLSVTEALLQEREGLHHSSAFLDAAELQHAGGDPVGLANSVQDNSAEAVTAGSSESLLAKPASCSITSQLEQAIILALKCLSKGTDRLQVAAIAQRVTGFLLASFDRLVATCGPAVWEAALQVQGVSCPLPAAQICS